MGSEAVQGQGWIAWTLVVAEPMRPVGWVWSPTSDDMRGTFFTHI